MEKFSVEKINPKIVDLLKKLLDLKMKKATRQSFKSHEFKKTKREIARVLTLKT